MKSVKSTVNTFAQGYCSLNHTIEASAKSVSYFRIYWATACRSETGSTRSSPDSSNKHKLSTPEPYLRRRCVASATTDSQVTTGRGSREKTFAHHPWCWSDSQSQATKGPVSRTVSIEAFNLGKIGWRVLDRTFQQCEAFAPGPGLLQSDLVFQGFSQKSGKAQPSALCHRSRPCLGLMRNLCGDRLHGQEVNQIGLPCQYLAAYHVCFKAKPDPSNIPPSVKLSVKVLTELS